MFILGLYHLYDNKMLYLKQKMFIITKGFSSMKYKWIIIMGTLVSLTGATASPAYAIGYNPAFKKSNNAYKAHLSTEQDIINSVHDQLVQVPDQGIAKYYVHTDLNKVLNTDFAKVDYPSRDKTKSGFDDNGKLDINALKQPISQPEKIQLANTVRYYYFNFTNARTFTDLVAVDNKDGDYSDSDKVSKDDKLNYFDYIKLIDAIKANPKYTESQRDRRLIDVETDLQNSINILYGISNIAHSNAADSSDNSLIAWRNDKSVEIPFQTSMFSYAQLLAAYNKSEVITDTLSFYATLTDTLNAIKTYCVSVRQDRGGKINPKEFEKQIQTKYTKLDKSLVQPMVDVVNEQRRKANQKEEGDKWNTSKLGKLGITSRKANDNDYDDNDDDDY